MDRDRLAQKYPGLQFQPGPGKRMGRLRESLRKFVRMQFARPTGIWGSIVGTIMANAPSNQERIRWTIGQLDLRPDDRVLEIGFGPGFAVKEAVRSLPRGFIAGVDHSDVMVRQAIRRNAEAVQSGHVDLRLGSVSSLPTYTQRFDKIFTINSIHFWTDPTARLSELRELLRPDGLIAVTLQPRTRGSTAETTQTIGQELVLKLERAGYKNVRLALKHAEPAPIACVLGTR